MVFSAGKTGTSNIVSIGSVMSIVPTGVTPSGSTHDRSVSTNPAGMNAVGSDTS